MSNRILFGLSILMAVISACEKPKNLIYNGDRIRIDSIRPLFVKEGQSFTIYGKNFNPVAVKNIITINNIPAQGNVMEGRIQVTLPTGVFPSADTLLAQLILKKEGKAYVDTAYFYSSQTPRVYSMEPTIVHVGDTITITGEGFVSPRDKKSIVFIPPGTTFRGVMAETYIISDKLIKVRVPPDAVSGDLIFFTKIFRFIIGSNIGGSSPVTVIH